MRMGKYTPYNDKTQSISSTQSTAIYAFLEYLNQISENHIGMMQISELVGRHQLRSSTILKTSIMADMLLLVQFVAHYVS